MFIAMNRFRIHKGSEADFEKVWKDRDSLLEEVPGFVEFDLLRGPDQGETTLYASHTIWRDRAAFEACTQSEHFRKAHANTSSNRGLYAGHPEFEGFEAVEGA